MTTSPMNELRPSPLLSLPLELIVEVINFLLGPLELFNTLSTCRVLHQIIHQRQQQFTLITLRTCIGPELVEEAVWIIRCQPVYQPNEPVPPGLDDSPERSTLCGKFAVDFLTKGPPALQDLPCTLAEAMELAQFHTNTTLPFTRGILQAYNGQSRFNIQDSLQKTPATTEERRRIMRAFYRFELFCKLYSCYTCDWDHIDQYMEDYYPQFFDRLAPWEIHQISCIHDFLARQICSQFQIVLDIDKRFAREWSSSYSVHDDAIQHFSDLRGLLCKKMLPPIENHDFWLGFLNDGAYFISEDVPTRLLQGKQSYPDPDSGAELVWIRSPDELDREIYRIKDNDQRKWGYVLWDEWRLREVGAVKEPSTIPQ